ncbi:MAG: ATP-binding cassette domain-containing protein, partial [Desulfobacteraceae bacterium]
MIELTNLTKTYGAFTAVDRLNLRVERGEIFGFIGPNGAGKTTTIKMMGGVLAPTEGSVAVCGIDLQADPENAKRRIGFIPDRPYLYE